MTTKQEQVYMERRELARPAGTPKNFGEALTRASQRVSAERDKAKKALSESHGSAGEFVDGAYSAYDHVLHILEEEYKDA